MTGECQSCGNELTERSVSDDFCCESCQINWTRRCWSLPSLQDELSQRARAWQMTGFVE